MTGKEFHGLRTSYGVTPRDLELGTGVGQEALLLFERGELSLPFQTKSEMTSFVRSFKRKKMAPENYVRVPEFPVALLHTSLAEIRISVAHLMNKAASVLAAVEMIEKRLARMENLDSGEGVASEIPRRNEEIARSQDATSSSTGQP